MDCDQVRATYQGYNNQSIVNAKCNLLHMSRCHTDQDGNDGQDCEDDRASINLLVVILFLDEKKFLRAEAGSELSKRRLHIFTERMWKVLMLEGSANHFSSMDL
jgi:hypothetical protein